MLPIAQIGNMLSKNQWTEEIPDAADEPGEVIFTNFNHPFLPPIDYTTPVSSKAETKSLAYIHHSEQIPSNHPTEVVSPPPDTFFM